MELKHSVCDDSAERSLGFARGRSPCGIRLAGWRTHYLMFMLGQGEPGVPPRHLQTRLELVQTTSSKHLRAGLRAQWAHYNCRGCHFVRVPTGQGVSLRVSFDFHWSHSIKRPNFDKTFQKLLTYIHIQVEFRSEQNCPSKTAALIVRGFSYFEDNFDPLIISIQVRAAILAPYRNVCV